MRPIILFILMISVVITTGCTNEEAPMKLKQITQDTTKITKHEQRK